MSGTRLLDYNPLTREWMTFKYDHANDVTTIGYHQDVEPILEWNKRQQINVDKSKARAKRDMLLYARVPNIVQMDMLVKHGVRFWDRNHGKKVMALLNSPEYAHCKVSHIKHDR